MKEIPTKYNAKEAESKWHKYWMDNKLNSAVVDKKKKAYSIVIPPPNITGVLHMGHALNNTIQDILIRWKRMQGYSTLWMPGTDHAGIATQNVVERMLKKKNSSRENLGREKFLEEVWQWREDYGSSIINQLKKMGCSCDWDRTRFTMDEGLSKSVGEVFIRLYERGLIYRGNYIINWCPRCKTALSDEESEHKDIKGLLYYIKYPIKDSKNEYLSVATTRPETMLGDTALAVNAKDERYKKYIGKKVILPIIEREIEVIADEYVDLEFGTGVVKITPAHDPNDFIVAGRHNLAVLNIMNDDATMNEKAGKYNGMDRYECREALLVDLKDRCLLESTKMHDNAVGHCYRCHTVVEPRLSLQWFVKMKPLAKKAIEVVEKEKVKFHPKRWTKVYLEWMYNIRDWCISRQIWWGHRIPVWHCKECQTSTIGEGRGTKDERGETKDEGRKGFVVSINKPDKCPDCGNTNLEQDPDVLDTWFSSWLWPFSTMGWPEKTKELDFYYPTNALVTAQEIIFFWVARMIMAGIEFIGDIPFSDVYIHGTVRDETGTKMSKSLGNVIDPLEIIDEYGADALRFSIIAITAQGQDVYLSKHRFETGRNFCNKIWNASRFLLMNLEPMEDLNKLPEQNLWSHDDWYIIGKLQKVIQDVSKNLTGYSFKEASSIIYDYFWHDLCDKYIEAVKPVLYGDNAEEKKVKQRIVFYVLDTALKVLHPFMPFITEEIWQCMQELIGGSEEKSIMMAQYPISDKKYYSEERVKSVEDKHDLLRAGRLLRSEYSVAPSAKVDFYIKPVSKNVVQYFSDDIVSVTRFLRAENVYVDMEFNPEGAMPAEVTASGTIYMSVKDLDRGQESNRLNKEIEKLSQEIKKVEKKLNNKNFCSKAPAEVINKEKKKKEEFEAKIDKLKEHLECIK